MNQNKTNEVKTLRELLKEKAINKTKLASRIGISRQILTDWEKGRYVPAFDNAVKLAAELQISLKTLAASLGYDVSAVPTVDPIMPQPHGIGEKIDHQRQEQSQSQGLDRE